MINADLHIAIDVADPKELAILAGALMAYAEYGNEDNPRSRRTGQAIEQRKQQLYQGTTSHEDQDRDRA